MKRNRLNTISGLLSKLAPLLMASLLFCGCGRQTTDSTASGPPPKHEHKPPHGGTPVVLGDEEFHVEFVLDPASSVMEAYVFDGELENFTRVAQESFDVATSPADGAETLVFKAVPNQATGEKIGDTSMFEARANWLKTKKTFDAILKRLVVRGKTYDNVAFNFPKGNDQDDKK